MAAVFDGAGAVVVTILADILIANLKQAVGCKRECKKLEKTIEKIRPYLRQVEIQLAKKRNEAQQNCEIMAKWLADMKEQLEAANLELHEYFSGPEVLATLNVIGNRRTGKRIEEVNNEIDLLCGKALTMAVFAFNLANTPQAANTQALVADTAQQQNANALHHGYCSTPNIVQQQNANALHHGYSSTPNILQTPDFQSEHAFHPGHSLPAVRTSHYPPMADQSMSQHSSPVTAHRTPSSLAFSNQSQAAASWTPPGDHRRQSIDHPGFLRGANSAQETLRQLEVDIHLIKNAEEKTRSDQRCQSIANPQQRVPTSYQPSAPPHYQAPSAQPRHNDPSAPPLRDAAPLAPYSLFYSHCTE